MNQHDAMPTGRRLVRQSIRRGPTMRWAVALILAASCTGAVADNADPWEGMNRKIHGFNDVADRWVLKPMARGYRWTLPDGARRSVGNFFQNLSEPANSIHQMLQGKPARGVSDFGRFLINSTVGIGGLFDPAQEMGMPRHDEDFGQTFGRWGMGSGPYFVIPLRGPSTVRDGFGLALDSFLNPLRYVNDVPWRNSLYVLSVIDVRSELLSSEALLSGDEYLFIRDAYLQRRDFLVSDGAVAEEDPFLDEFDDDY